MRSILLIGAFILGGHLLTGGEAAVKCTADQVAACVARAPQPPTDLTPDLRLKLVDFVDFTNPDDPHDMIDRGTSKIVTGPAGTYRVTAAHRHAQFAVRWKAAAPDVPHVLVWEYPDDAKREICFFTHESMLSGRKNIDWSLETGVYCGDPLPVSGKMQYHTFFFWPADAWPVAMVMNWARSGPPAAASRLWVFAVEGGLPPLTVTEPDARNPRRFGTFYNWSLVPTRGIFGLKDPKTALEHIVDYHLYRGDNFISWPVVSNNTWGFRCQIPAWDGGTGKAPYNVELDEILAVCERKGLGFLPTINAGHAFKIKGGTYAADNQAYKDGYRAGLTQFLERYGASKAMLGINFDSQDLSPKLGESGLDNARDCLGGLDKVVALIRDKAPNLKVYHFLGGRHIHEQYFHDASDVVARWEKGEVAWSQFLGDEVNRLWTSWRRDPAELKGTAGLTTVVAYQNDDHAIFDEYFQNPRAIFYYDMEGSRAKAALVNSRAAQIWNTFFEGYIGLQPANWWYMKLWVAPDFNPAPPLALAGWARAMSHRDRDFLIAGSWNRKGGGHEAALRRWAQAFRSLPPAEMQDVPVRGSTPVLIRTAAWQGKTYVACLNPTPYAASIAVDLGSEKRAVELPPFALQTLVGAGELKVAAAGEAAAPYVAWVGERLKEFGSLAEEVRKLDAAAVPAAFDRHLANAKKSAAAGQWLATDVELGFGLTAELALRKRILAPPAQRLPKLTAPPPMNGNLDAWPAAAEDLRTSDANIATHLFFTNQWEGAKDLSARIRLGHDGSKLYIGIAVQDDTLSAKDGLSLCLSPANYRQWQPHNLKYESTLSLGLPLKAPEVTGQGAHGFSFTSRRVDGGYVAEGVLDLKSLDLKSGSRIGWAIQVADDDNTPHLNNPTWARKSVLLVPNAPTFTYWDDARTCGELVLE